MTDNTTIPIEIQPADHNRPNAEAPEPTPEPVAPVITIIEEEPLKMVRPRSLVNGKEFAEACIFAWSSDAWLNTLYIHPLYGIKKKILLGKVEKENRKSTPLSKEAENLTVHNI